MKRVFRFLCSLLEIVIIFYVIVVTAFILFRNKYGFTQFGDYTFNDIDLLDEKNIKDTKKGDLLVVKKSDDIKKGDLIYYYAIYNEDYIIQSDVVVDVDNDDRSPLFIVGDQEKTTVTNARVLGKYANVYPKLGVIFTTLESKIGFIFLVMLPIIIVFIHQMYDFVTTIRGASTNRINRKKVNDKKSESSKTITDESEIL